VTPMVISSTTPFLMEMLAMFPSSKASGARMGLLNQSMCPDGIKSLVSTAYMEC
jgi:hypothetical protein